MKSFKNDGLMKNLFKVIFVAAATTTLFACNKEIENPTPETPVSVRTVQFSAGPVTRTVFGTPSGSSVPTLWTENKTVGISLNFAPFKESNTPEVASGGATANFSANIDDSGSAPYTFYAVSPYSSVISASASYCSVQVDIPASQTPLATSVDENAQILVAKHSAGSSFPTSSVTLDFTHLTAYGKISFSNLLLAAGESIASVSLTAAENWVGRYYYYFEDHDPYSEGDLAENSVGKTLTLTTSSATDIWFACAPVNLSGKTVKVVITTDKATTYTKNITIPAGKTFASGKVNAFTINMNGITADSAAEYELVTDPSELTAGKKVIIAAPGDYAVAMSTTQNSNNRGSASVTKSQNNTIISSPSDAVQIFTIVGGTTTGTIAFSTGSGYIYAAASDKNYLRTEETLSANSSWSVSIDSDGIATVIAQGDNTRNHLRYNAANNPPVFGCYAETSSVETKVSLFVPASNWELNSIAVTTSPDKTTYEAGEDFDPTGMVVTAHYVDADNNSHTKNVVLNNADLTISPSTSLTAGTTSVSISYGGKSTTQAITVTAPIIWDLKSIAVTTAPSKTNYTEGEFFDPTGMVVTATYENHDNTAQTKTETVDNNDLTFSPTTSTALTTSDTAITITYNGKTTSQTIKVDAVGSKKTYTLTIDYNTLDQLTSGSGYATYNGDHTITATATDKSTTSVVVNSYQVMSNTNNNQWQKSKGVIYNKTDLGAIKSVTVNSTSGTFTTTYGSSESPSGSTLGSSDGYFKVAVGSATGYTTSIVVVFEK